ncbi:MAG TPA: HAD-IA family hydrolase [Gaiellaceae bacterium]|nr:HAD-IA family hydrolase [Gaiellaceae bacterium]
MAMRALEAELDSLRSHWRTALLSADAALHAGGGFLTPAQSHDLRKHLQDEYAPTAALLRAFARDEGIPPELAEPFLPRVLARRLLRLPPEVAGCVFDLEDVLVGSAGLHLAAWQRTFSELLTPRLEATYRRFMPPFDPRTDYPQHLQGRTRLDGVRAFLAGRGIRLPEGSPGDPPGTETVHGIANRKHELFGRYFEERGAFAFEGSRHYLELARDAGVKSAVVSASAHTEEILEHAGLADLVDAVVDAEEIVARELQGRPQPDRLLAACRALRLEPARAAVFESSGPGVEAGRAAGFRLVVAIDPDEHPAHVRELRREGADVATPGLAALLLRSA